MTNERDVPRDCWTCKHRAAVEVTACVGAAIYEQHCSKFVRACLNSAEPLTCKDAYKNFCGGGDYKPNVWARVVKVLTLKK